MRRSSSEGKVRQGDGEFCREVSEVLDAPSGTSDAVYVKAIILSLFNLPVNKLDNISNSESLYTIISKMLVLLSTTVVC